LVGKVLLTVVFLHPRASTSDDVGGDSVPSVCTRSGEPLADVLYVRARQALPAAVADGPLYGCYTATTKQDVEEILAVEAELLRSEGVDPRWPGFPEDRKPEDHQQK
jgi:hypothetical protein